jgi:hypothetical protein
MDQMRRLYPGLSIDHVRALADIVAVERDGVLTVNEVYSSARWGVACLSYDVPRLAIRRLSDSPTCSPRGPRTTTTERA